MFHVDNVSRMSSYAETSQPRRLFGLLNILIIGLLIVSGSCHLTPNDIKTSEKLSDRHDRQVSLLEDEMCLASYDVSEGSIIRTHDSQQLGAKYLNETDLGQRINSRDDCLRLCCRTAHCNVAVFEEKNSGSCYLFDCGPVEDLRCKFTSQPHYMSAILRKREIPFPNLNQHETELSQLRTVDGAENNKGTLMLNNNNNNNGNVIGSNSNEPNRNKQPDTDIEAGRTTLPTPTTTTTVPPQLLHQQQQPLQQQPQPNLMDSSNSQLQPQFQQQQQPQPLTQRRSPCGRNQFECKSSGECIAIYNACDGIPQCADGSDESSELHCPSDSTNQNPVVQKPKIVPASIALSPLGHSLSSGGSNGLENGNFNHNGFEPNHQRNEHMDGPSQQEEFRLPPPQQQSMSSNVMINNKNNGKGDPMLSSQPQIQPPSPLNIFTHKDGGIMDEHENYGSQLQQQRHSSYWKPSSFDYNAGDSSASNSNGNGYGMAVVPLANSGLYGSGVNNNNNYGSGPSSSYAYPQYPQGIPSQSQQLQQQQYGQYANGNNINFNNLQPNLQPPQQQQQLLQQGQYYSGLNAAGNPVYNNQNSNLNNGLSNPNSAPYNMMNSPNRLLPPNNRPLNQVNLNGLPQQQSSVNQQNSMVLPIPGVPNQMMPSTSSQTITRTANVSVGSSGSGDQAKATLVSAPSSSVNYNGVSKLELPQSLRTLSSQIQSFASESEKDDLTDHSAGPGAVLAFVMGLGMSIIMVIIVGCRLRRIGNRRRGKNRLDPDYLVDGMYL